MDVAVVFSLLAILLLHQHQARAQFLDALCGYTGLAPKIMGGTRAQHGANPWMAYLYLDTNTFLCGGTLIHKNFVLTAAHCIVQSENIRIRLGELYSQTRANSSQDFEVSMAFRNRLHNQADHSHDIGMLKLDRSAVYNAYIRPICIFTHGSDAPYVSTYTATGWGNTETEKTATVLQSVQLYDWNLNYCARIFPAPLNPGQICAGHTVGDTCMGDSGGPLYQRVTVGGALRYVQFGIVSYGNGQCRSPGIYTRVSSYVDWVLKVIRLYGN